MRRELHPVAWWVWALGLASAATATTNPFALLLIVGVASVVVAVRRGDQPWAGSFRLYLMLGLLVIVIRLAFRIVFGAMVPGHVLFTLPEIPLPDWVLGIRLLGPVTLEGLLGGLYDGMRLATIIICVGAANCLANPKRLLASLPPALYEIGSALVVAFTIFPQLAESVTRVRAARALRGGSTERFGGIRRLLVPVLEDAIDRSLALAAGMDTRGYGRAPGLTRGERWRTGSLLIGGLCGLCLGVYAALDGTTPRWLSTPVLLVAVALAIGGLSSAGRRVRRVRYRPDPFALPEVLVLVSGVAVGVAVWWVAQTSPLVAYPDVTAVPIVTLPLLLSILVGLVPAVAAPLPPRLEPAAEVRDDPRAEVPADRVREAAR